MNNKKTKAIFIRQFGSYPPQRQSIADHYLFKPTDFMNNDWDNSIGTM